MRKPTILMAVLCLIACGCVEQEKTPTWGKGELPADYLGFFPDDNTSRLNYAQNDLLNKHEALLRGLDGKDKDGKAVHQSGVVDILMNLDARLRAQEATDPNKATLESRVAKLETRLDNSENVAVGTSKTPITTSGDCVPLGTKPLQTVDDWNAKAEEREAGRRKKWLEDNTIGTGLACPKCGTELINKCGLWIERGKTFIWCEKCKYETISQ